MTMAAPYTFVASPGPASSYSFKTYQGKPVGIRVGTRLNLAGTTLVLEFDKNSNFPAPMSIGTITYTSGAIHIAMTAQEVDQLKGGFYRVRATSATSDFALLAGNVEYEEIEVESDLLDDTGVIRIDLLPLDLLVDRFDDVFLPRVEYAGAGGIDVATIQGLIDQNLQAHEQAPSPHAAYDVDMPDLQLLFENKLV